MLSYGLVAASYVWKRTDAQESLVSAIGDWEEERRPWGQQAAAAAACPELKWASCNLRHK